jgi:5-methyltetrahydrofolate--homocysteine methyltransferase
MQPPLERLARGEVLVGDGAWGTMLMERGLAAGAPPESFVLSRPEVIGEIAGLYVEAGADLITTDTFGASSLALERHKLDPRTEEINRRAVEEARRATRGKAYISASVGPTGRLLKPFGDTEPEAMKDAFERQVRGLTEAGPDLVCVETMTDLTEARLAIEAARSLAPGVPVMATMTFDVTPRGFFTVMGVSLEQAAAGLEDAGAEIVGSNCGNGIEAMIRIARELRGHTKLPIAIQANAGLPENRKGVVVYPETPEFMAEKALELLELGVSVIGGCCGTTPAHIRALRAVIDARPPFPSGERDRLRG